MKFPNHKGKFLEEHTLHNGHVWLWKFLAEKFKITWSFYVHADVLSLPDFSSKSLFPPNPNTSSSAWSTKIKNLILHWPSHLLLFRVHHFYHIIFSPRFCMCYPLVFSLFFHSNHSQLFSPTAVNVLISHPHFSQFPLPYLTFAGYNIIFLERSLAGFPQFS